MSIPNDCPEWCDHDGPCAEARAGIHAAESYAENAWLRAAEAGDGSDDRDREEEAYDVGLAQMRADRAAREEAIFAREERRMAAYDDGFIWSDDR